MNARIAVCAGGVLLCATASMIVVGPNTVAGQTDNVQSRTVHTGVPAPNYQRPVQQAQYAPYAQPQAPSAPTQESETTRQLRLLYERDGKQMPEMNIKRLPMVTHSPGFQNLRPVDPNQKSSSPLGILNRLFSLGRRTTPPPRPPAYYPPQYRLPVAPTPYVSPSRTVHQPPAARSDPPQPLGNAPQLRPGVPAARVSSSRTRPAAIKPAADDIPVLIDEREEAAKSAQPQKTAAAAAPRAVPAETKTGTAAGNPFPSDSAARANQPLPPRTNSAQGLNRDSDAGPFTGQTLTDGSNDSKSQPAGPMPQQPVRAPQWPSTARSSAAVEAGKSAAPLQIKSLQEMQGQRRTPAHPLAEPKILGTAGPAAKAVAASSPRTAREERLRRIAERRGLAGFRGFCPVVLRDDRELADGKLEFQSDYRGKTYHFSSATAKAAFDRAPEKYAPASAGIDVVEFADALKQVDGSLEHAVWFRGRLYFFAGAQTLRTFVKEPGKYAVEE